MPVKHFVQIGRIALIKEGHYAGKLCVILNIIDQNRALVSGPGTGVPRQPIQFKKLSLTRFLMKNIHFSIGDKALYKKWKKETISKEFSKTRQGLKLAAIRKKRKMNDFDRFKLYKIKQRMNRLIREKTQRLLAAEKRKNKPIKGIKTSAEKTALESEKPKELAKAKSKHAIKTEPLKSTSKSSTAKSSAAKSSTAKSSTAKASSAKVSSAKSTTGKASTAKTSSAKSTTGKASTAKTSSAKSTTEKASTAKTSSAKSTTEKASTAKTSTEKLKAVGK